ncbi:EFR1 family ferrodoxin [Acetanaerobacterium elongatum]|uniref:Flavodoxin domain-containing protein n=1 Tax=Acetanaerobacterium elongatum TaxID=258515 RepID=A0A1H0BYM8_9FIRM|nr:EFR1 family ferrodoxin [Acetanaerobacterium elongatum]SDN50781.1 Flavodoxin domain-containing protein [Acetanaerobacterium elongatum]
MKNAIFYFSGTGNSLQVATDIAEKIGECEVLNLAKYNTNNEITAERVGLVFPVYFWGIPNIIARFLSEIKLAGNPYLFAVVTCGNTVGASLVQVNELLRAKNFKLHSGFMIKMPENYIVKYDAGSKEKQQKRFDDEALQVSAISKVVLNKIEQPLAKSKYLIDTLFGKPVNRSAAKDFPTNDINFRVNALCTGCGKCERICSVGNITMINNKPTWNHHCELCLGCLQNCPVEAINYGNKTQKRTRYTNPHVQL